MYVVKSTGRCFFQKKSLSFLSFIQKAFFFPKIPKRNKYFSFVQSLFVFPKVLGENVSIGFVVQSQSWGKGKTNLTCNCERAFNS